MAEVIIWKTKKEPVEPASIFVGTIPAGGEISISPLELGIVSIPGFGISRVMLPPVSGMPKGGRLMWVSFFPFTG